MTEPEGEHRWPWPRPEQAAAGALDRVSVGHWPGLAAYWLAAGFDSGPLRQLADLRSGEMRAALDLMPGVLRSLGFDPAAADAGFTALCQGALDVVQRDLDVTGYGRYRMRAHLAWGWPAEVFAALPDGSYWSGGWGMTRGMDGAPLLFNAAGSVSATLMEVHEIEWPACAAHAGDPMTPPSDDEEPVALIDEVAWWWCTRTGHALAPVGQLAAASGQTALVELPNAGVGTAFIT